MNICEYCNDHHDGSYASGRFCNVKCSRGFSTSNNRKAINEKKKRTLLENNSKPERFCRQCNKSMGFNYRPIAKYCSRECSWASDCSDKTRELLSKKAHERDLKGSYGHRKIFQYNGKIVRTDSLLEVACLQYLCDTYSPQTISRCSLRLKYTDYEGHDRVYNPDFTFTIGDTKYIVECKSTQHSGSKENTHWNRYTENTKLKRKCLETYCDDNDIVYIHYTQTMSKTETKRYRKLKTQNRKNPCKVYTYPI
jgi:hypothetical protein